MKNNSVIILIVVVVIAAVVAVVSLSKTPKIISDAYTASKAMEPVSAAPQTPTPVIEMPEQVVYEPAVMEPIEEEPVVTEPEPEPEPVPAPEPLNVHPSFGVITGNPDISDEEYELIRKTMRNEVFESLKFND